jgi:hypothetical protein
MIALGNRVAGYVYDVNQPFGRAPCGCGCPPIRDPLARGRIWPSTSVASSTDHPRLPRRHSRRVQWCHAISSLSLVTQATLGSATSSSSASPVSRGSSLGKIPTTSERRPISRSIARADSCYGSSASVRRGTHRTRRSLPRRPRVARRPLGPSAPSARAPASVPWFSYRSDSREEPTSLDSGGRNFFSYPQPITPPLPTQTLSPRLQSSTDEPCFGAKPSAFRPHIATSSRRARGGVGHDSCRLLSHAGRRASGEYRTELRIASCAYIISSSASGPQASGPQAFARQCGAHASTATALAHSAPSTTGKSHFASTYQVHDWTTQTRTSVPV